MGKVLYHTDRDAKYMGGIAGAFISPQSDWFADKYGIKEGLLLGTNLMALVALIFANAPDWLNLIPAMLIMMLSRRMLITVCPMACGN